ncbi:MAG: efflux RND transporter permease subunit, partial [Spirochaetia bacterium]|nr:efflux RND transporter permease subunit [Spirochaetia bacterium]
YPYDVYRHLYYTVAEPVVDKFFDREVETDVKLRGDAKYRESLEGLLSMPVLTDDGIMEAEDLITVHRIPAQGRICHRNRMRCLSLSVTGISRKKLSTLVRAFKFSGSCHGEVL